MQRIGAIRTFAKAAQAANHAPPIKIFGIPGRYAEATYVAASKVSLPRSIIMPFVVIHPR